uniref:ARID domain-containing protein n=1 Tax=Tetranychus urticae TaxID=32264 RepID=T1KE96_TETUR
MISYAMVARLMEDLLMVTHYFLGTPVNGVTILAKQVLDLYELYRLVVSHGGLVEVINRKIWREITKGLCLPSSITSAAFTLRTHYMKYLHPYECDRENVRHPEELRNIPEVERILINAGMPAMHVKIDKNEGRDSTDSSLEPHIDIEISLVAIGTLGLVEDERSAKLERVVWDRLKFAYESRFCLRANPLINPEKQRSPQA